MTEYLSSVDLGGQIPAYTLKVVEAKIEMPEGEMVLVKGAYWFRTGDEWIVPRTKSVVSN